MTKKHELTKENLQTYLDRGMSTRDIEREINFAIKHQTINYWIHKYGLQKHMNLKYQKSERYMINRIDTPEKAYILGFIACDGHINKNDIVDLCVCIADREILDFIAKYINQRIVNEDYTFDKKSKRFPNVQFGRKISDIKTFIGGPLKKDRHLPIVRDDFNRYLLLGAFDADGCISWGMRKDKNRLWYKISFTSQYNICLCIQNILLKKLNIATSIKPKGKENCYVMDFCNKENVLKFLNYIYPDNSFVILKRKYYKQKALRLELEENGGTTIK